MNRRRILRDRVLARGRELRGTSRNALKTMMDADDDRFTIEGRRAWISVWIEEQADELIVFVRGHLPRWIGCSDEFDGFRLTAEDLVIDLTDEEIQERW